MKKFLTAVMENNKPLSKKLLFSSFMAGYLLATLLFAFFQPQVHHFIQFNTTRTMNLIYTLLRFFRQDRERSVALFELRRKLKRSHTLWA